MKLQQKLYKIVNKNGLFSSGGTRPYFTKSGKTWKGIGPLKNHFHLLETLAHHGYKTGNKLNETSVVYEDCHIVEYKVVIDEESKVSIEEFVNGKNIFVKLEDALKDANSNSP